MKTKQILLLLVLLTLRHFVIMAHPARDMMVYDIPAGEKIMLSQYSYVAITGVRAGGNCHIEWNTMHYPYPEVHHESIVPCSNLNPITQ